MIDENEEARAEARDLIEQELTPSIETIRADEQLRKLYEPALAAAAAINLVRTGNAGMAPFVGAAGVVLSGALEPLIKHFGDGEMTFKQVFGRIGIPVVAFSDLPDAPEVETPAVERGLTPEGDTRADLGYREDEDIPDIPERSR